MRRKKTALVYEDVRRPSHDEVGRMGLERPGRATTAPSVESRVIRFFLLFLALQAAFFGAELTPWVQEYFVVPWTNPLAAISALLVTLFDPNVTAVGKVLRSTMNGFAVSIEAGCNGVEATIVLLAAILAFPAPWSTSSIGLLAGIVAVQGLNVVRVISLFYLGQWNFAGLRVGASVRVAGADHARRPGRVAGLGAHAAGTVTAGDCGAAPACTQRQLAPAAAAASGRRALHRRRPLSRLCRQGARVAAGGVRVWYFAAPVLLWPARMLVELVARRGFAGPR